jgi:hypothetical protein
MMEVLLEAERLMSLGLLDRAERTYRDAIAADPRNSIAVVGLARVTLERGDEGAAYLLARRALAIEPENAAADRMAARLREVLATRGEPIPDDKALAGLDGPPGAATPPDRAVPPAEPAPPAPAPPGQPGSRRARRAGRAGILGRLFGPRP